MQNLLIVTDHTTHSSSNSIYELAVALTKYTMDVKVWVCSKGIKENHSFFNAISGAPVYGMLINDSFSYDPIGLSFGQSSVAIRRDDIDIIIVRMPQPLDKIFLRSLTSIVSPEKIVNNPEGTIETSSKAFLLKVGHLCPELSLCQNANDAIQLSQEMEIVLKPLYSYGGIGIIRLSKESVWDGDHKYSVDEISKRLPDTLFPMLAMKYLPNVAQGDKRTIVVNKTILGSALRMPPKGSWICNVANGGQAVLAKTDEEELQIERELTPLLFEKGVIMYGFDTLMADNGKRVLSEINTLSIGGLGPLSELSGKPILNQTARLLWGYFE